MTVERESFPVSRPDYQSIRAAARRIPGIDLEAVEGNIEFIRVASQMFSDADAFFARYGISRVRFLTLVALYQDREGYTPGDLAERLQVTRATMTGVVDTLEEGGNIERRRDQADRRTHRVVITAKGVECVEGIMPFSFGRMGVIMRHLSADERAQLLGLLKKLEAGMDDIRAQEAQAKT